MTRCAASPTVGIDDLQAKEDLNLRETRSPAPANPDRQRIALGIAYVGSHWKGWQTQPGGQTVQDRLEAALGAFAGHPVSTICAGRTDSGVHALSQVVHVDVRFERQEYAWVNGVNRHLPSSIAVQWARVVSSEFHARFSATARRYTYVIYNSREIGRAHV